MHTHNRTLGLLAVLASLAMLTTPSTVAGHTGTATRIVGGGGTLDNVFPPLVSLLSNGQLLCGGTLITPTRVLTAAHCINSVSPSGLVARAGTTLSSGGVDVAVSGGVQHPGYNRTVTSPFDIAVLTLASPLTGPSIAVAALSNTEPPVGSDAMLIGRGTTDPGRSLLYLPAITQHADVEVLPLTGCGFTPESVTTGAHICGAGVSSSSPSVASCLGDSGSPFLVSAAGSPDGWVVSAVASFGYVVCGGSGTKGMYVRTDYVYSWIVSQLDVAPTVLTPGPRDFVTLATGSAVDITAVLVAQGNVNVTHVYARSGSAATSSIGLDVTALAPANSVLHVSRAFVLTVDGPLVSTGTLATHFDGALIVEPTGSLTVAALDLSSQGSLTLRRATPVRNASLDTGITLGAGLAAWSGTLRLEYSATTKAELEAGGVDIVVARYPAPSPSPSPPSAPLGIPDEVIVLGSDGQADFGFLLGLACEAGACRVARRPDPPTASDDDSPSTLIIVLIAVVVALAIATLVLIAVCLRSHFIKSADPGPSTLNARTKHDPEHDSRDSDDSDDSDDSRDSDDYSYTDTDTYSDSGTNSPSSSTATS